MFSQLLYLSRISDLKELCIKKLFFPYSKSYIIRGVKETIYLIYEKKLYFLEGLFAV